LGWGKRGRQNTGANRSEAEQFHNKRSKMWNIRGQDWVFGEEGGARAPVPHMDRAGSSVRIMVREGASNRAGTLTYRRKPLMHDQQMPVR